MRRPLSILVACGIISGAVGGVLLATGFGTRTGYERYIPSEESSRETLATALQAWQDSVSIPKRTPPIEVVDSHRRPGQRLQSHQILGPVPGDAPRCFAVRLQLENPREERKVRYVVFGLDPLWVMRYDDYEMMAHMDHPVPPLNVKTPR